MNVKTLPLEILVCLLTFGEVGPQKYIKDTPREAFNCVSERQDMYASPIFNVHAWVKPNCVAWLHAQIHARYLIYLNTTQLHIVRRQDYQNRVSPLISTMVAISAD